MANPPTTSEPLREAVEIQPASLPVAIVPPPIPPSLLGNTASALAADLIPSDASKLLTEKDSAKAGSEGSQPHRFQVVTVAMRSFWHEVPSWVTSLVVHAAVLVILGLWYIDPGQKSGELEVVATPDVVDGDLQDLESIDASDAMTFDSSLDLIDSGPLQDGAFNPLANDEDAAPASVDLASLNDPLVHTEDLLKTTGVPGASGEGLGGRSGAAKGELLKKGGSEGSEAAVTKALKWLTNHQLPDGGWNFNLKKCPGCRGNCKDSGDGEEARMGATAMALLPFLGAGQTHRQGQYKEVVRKGLYYLTTHIENTGGFLSMREKAGTMYSHGMGTIALCEAYAMTNDRTLIPYAQGAVNYIVYAQDPVGGGWRYEERSEGDTSVVGWQIMALKSAQMAGLEVPSSVFARATKFLNSVESEDGAAYGYVSPSAAYRRSTSSIGLLCRMYMGWKKDNPALNRGVSLIAREGPSIPARTDNRADMYYNYYATQVLRHWGGYEFDRWNPKMRDFLVKSQDQEGHEKGSWFFNFESHSSVGGRLYCTSMATMILEVYYRHLPIYGVKAVNDEFSQ